MLPQNDSDRKLAILPIEKRTMLKKSKTINVGGDTLAIDLNRSSTLTKRRAPSPKNATVFLSNSQAAIENELVVDESVVRKQQKEDTKSDGTTGQAPANMNTTSETSSKDGNKTEAAQKVDNLPPTSSKI